jgi:hypothetical protein
MSKPKVTQKQLLAFRELRDKLKNWEGEEYEDYSKSCPLCKQVGWDDEMKEKCVDCICWKFATPNEIKENSDNPRLICVNIYKNDVSIKNIRASYQKLKRRMQRAGIEVLK